MLNEIYILYVTRNRELLLGDGKTKIQHLKARVSKSIDVCCHCIVSRCCSGCAGGYGRGCGQ